MASPNTLALRRAQAGLRVREIPVRMPPVEPSTHVAVAIEMRRRSYLLNVQRGQRIAATNRGRNIPVGGPGRRRAKALRNKNAVERTEQKAGRSPRVTTADRLGDRREAGGAPS